MAVKNSQDYNEFVSLKVSGKIPEGLVPGPLPHKVDDSLEIYGKEAPERNTDYLNRQIEVLPGVYASVRASESIKAESYSGD